MHQHLPTELTSAIEKPTTGISMKTPATARFQAPTDPKIISLFLQMGG